MKYLPVISLFGLCAVAVLARPSHYPSADERSRAMSSWSSWGPGNGMTMFASAEDPWAMQPPPVWRMGEDGQPRPVDTEGPVKKKTSTRKGNETDEEDDDSNERGSSRANASFNAWFPIMLGMYPGQGGAEGDGARARPRPAPEGEGVAAIANSVNHGRSGVASSHAIIYSGEPPVNFANRRRSQPQQPFNQQQPFDDEQQQYNRQQPTYNQQQQRYNQPQHFYR